MSDMPIPTLLQVYCGRGIIVDTNLLLVFLIGQLDRSLIPIFKRTQAFTSDDCVLLSGFLARFQKIYTTPNILTEVNNLANQLPEKRRSRFMELFQRSIAVLREEYAPSTQVCAEPLFRRCGLTDTAIVMVARQKLLVLTDDFKLAGHLEKLKVDCINFNHIRFFPARDL